MWDSWDSYTAGAKRVVHLVGWLVAIRKRCQRCSRMRRGYFFFPMRTTQHRSSYSVIFLIKTPHFSTNDHGAPTLELNNILSGLTYLFTASGTLPTVLLWLVCDHGSLLKWLLFSNVPTPSNRCGDVSLKLQEYSTVSHRLGFLHIPSVFTGSTPDTNISAPICLTMQTKRSIWVG